MAAMIWSASMPFSLASASIVWSSGFAIALELDLEATAGDEPQRQPVQAPVGRFENDRVLFDAAQPAFERFLVVHRLAHHHLGEPAGEPHVIASATQWPVEPRRRDFQRVSEGQRIFHVENRAQLPVDLLAILHAHALVRRRGWSGAVDEHTHHVTNCLAPALDVPHFKTPRERDALGNCPNGVQSWRSDPHTFSSASLARHTFTLGALRAPENIPRNTKSGHEPTRVLPQPR